MSTISLTFPTPINISCKIGDDAFYAPVSEFNDFQFAGASNYIGEISNIVVGETDTVVTINEYQFTTASSTTLTTSSFVWFAKPMKVETSTIKGYYALSTFTSDSNVKSELYATTMVAEQSSK
tara:strand:+ start:112 stop:480 length:369 start_codon:yes stop_codon:yes gene_type:complete